jgi:hypothetical protein
VSLRPLRVLDNVRHPSEKERGRNSDAELKAKGGVAPPTKSIQSTSFLYSVGALLLSLDYVILFWL